ncbi:hypothetical protein [Adhaeribacter aquaticus]|uniref:hypothetical protein n=1 Tax=Adhaeribacter aquaticus TaxID=299567 RepID=UPI000411A38D|nr:hypothetical protein [Adhaeribacter aquaticus]
MTANITKENIVYGNFNFIIYLLLNTFEVYSLDLKKLIPIKKELKTLIESQRDLTLMERLEKILYFLED